MSRYVTIKDQTYCAASWRPASRRVALSAFTIVFKIIYRLGNHTDIECCQATLDFINLLTDTGMDWFFLLVDKRVGHTRGTR